MKRFESGEELAKEMGLKPEVLKKTFDDYNNVVKTKKDPFNKKVCVLFLLAPVIISRSFLVLH